jgi:hypothetical protein
VVAVLLLESVVRRSLAGSASRQGEFCDLRGADDRSQGLLLDNMLSAEVVLADGRSVMTSKVRHPALYWVSLASLDQLILRR